MTMTIAYDLPVKDLIAGLDATEHVTHTAHRKTHVTLHHNGGILSHEGVLSVWQTREASAHFDVDWYGDLAQYVRVNEYAWSCGNTEGNQRSISIEMCNETRGPEWKVREVTWRRAARLAGWLFFRVIGARPTRETLVQHKYWNPTECAGPHITSVYDHILWHAQLSYDAYASGQNPDGGDDVGFDQRLVNLEGYEDTAANFLTGAENKVDKLTRPIPVFGQDRTTTLIGEVSYLPYNFAQLNTKLDGLAAALAFLAQKVAEGGGSSAEELEAAVTRAIQGNALRVDISVQSQHEAALEQASPKPALNPGSDGVVIDAV
jgi:N-acetylmuramoyl-L-alanine amidase